jgi:AcrR family transcriptional regulator
MDEDLTPRERRHERTKDAILNAARKMIREGGADAISMRKIAQEIDYSPAGLYEYFGSKDEIIGALCQIADQRLESYMKAVDLTLPLDQRLVELGLAYVRFAVQNREEFLLLFTYLSNPPPPQLSDENPVPGGAFLVLMQTIQKAMDTGFIPSDPFDAFSTSYAAWAIVHGMAMLQVTALQSTSFPFVSVNRWALEQFVEGLRTP